MGENNIETWKCYITDHWSTRVTLNAMFNDKWFVIAPNLIEPEWHLLLQISFLIPWV